MKKNLFLSFLVLGLISISQVQASPMHNQGHNNYQRNDRPAMQQNYRREEPRRMNNYAPMPMNRPCPRGYVGFNLNIGGFNLNLGI